MSNEIWKPIRDYEDRYEVSNHGNIRVIKSRVNIFTEPKILNPEIYSKSQTQYKRVQLSNPRKRMLVHRLVADAFIDKPDSTYNVVNHLDNNGLNNHVSNLEWGTQSSNLKHAQNQGRLTEAQRKGGIVTSEKAQQAAMQDADSLIGIKKGSWTVVQNLGFISKGITKEYRAIYLECQCDCGQLYTVNRYYFKHKNFQKTCKNCKTKI